MQAASVNLATETAVVRVLLPDASPPSAAAQQSQQQQQAGGQLQQAQQPPAAAAADASDADLEAGLSPHERQLEAMGTGLARMLTDAGYAATMRQQGGGSSASSKVVAAKREERMRRLRWAAHGWLRPGGVQSNGSKQWVHRPPVQQLCRPPGRTRALHLALTIGVGHLCALPRLQRAQGDHAAAGSGVAPCLCLPAAPPHSLAGLRGAALAAPAGLNTGACRHVSAGAAG